jgi:hypothetical protein
VVAKVFRPLKTLGKVTCEKLHYSSETVGNTTRSHIEVHIKLEDGSEKSFEGKGQAVMPKLSSSTAMAWKSPEHEKWHGEFTASPLSHVAARACSVFVGFPFECRSETGVQSLATGRNCLLLHQAPCFSRSVGLGDNLTSKEAASLSVCWQVTKTAIWPPKDPVSWRHTADGTVVVLRSTQLANHY